MTFGHEFTGVVEEVGDCGAEPEGRRPCAGAVQHRLRQVRLLPAGAVRQLPRVEPAGDGRRRHLRLLAHRRRLRRRPGRVRARAVRRRRPDGDPRRHGPRRRGAAHRRGADRLPGGRDGRHPEGRHGRRLRRRAGRHHGRALRLAVRRRTGDRHRPRGIPARVRPPLRALRGLQLRVARRPGGLPEEDHRLRSAPTSASTPSAPRPPATRCRRCSAAS